VSVSYVWAHVAVPADLDAELRAEVDPVLAQPLGSPAREAFAAWCEDPLGFAFHGLPPPPDERARWIAFQGAFESERLDALFTRKILKREELSKWWLQPPNMPSLPWTNAAALLFYSLGPDRAQALPGARGNAFLAPDEVEPALTRSRAALDVRETELRRKAREIAGNLVGPEDDLAALRDALPWALEECRRRRAGFLWGVFRF
jgi:hypothetical protein